MIMENKKITEVLEYEEDLLEEDKELTGSEWTHVREDLKSYTKHYFKNDKKGVIVTHNKVEDIIEVTRITFSDINTLYNM